MTCAGPARSQAGVSPVATNLAHDGIASPVSSLEHESGKSSYGVAPPVGVVVDLDSVRTAPARLVRAGIGDAVSNLSAVADWELAAAQTGEPIDGLAATLARTAAQAVLHQPGGADGDGFRTVLAEALILSAMAMTVAGSSRPCSGGDHEILHAIDQLSPGAGTHGELAGVGALFCTWLRGDDCATALLADCLARHGLPRTPADLGLSAADFTKAVLSAPATRPGRFTGGYGDAALAPRAVGLARARRLAAALKVHRAIQAVELSLLILVAAVIDAVHGGLAATRVLTVACLVIAGLLVPAHLAAVMASRRLS